MINITELIFAVLVRKVLVVLIYLLVYCIRSLTIYYNNRTPKMKLKSMLNAYKIKITKK